MMSFHLDNMMPERLLQRIDAVLQDLEVTIEDANWISRAYRYPNPMDYIEVKTQWCNDLEHRWSNWKIENKGSEKIQVYEDKLKRCHVILNVMLESLLGQGKEPEEDIEAQLLAQAIQESLSMAQTVKIPSKNEAIYQFIHDNEIEKCDLFIGSLSSSEKEKFLSSTAKFHSSWALADEEMTPLQYACFSKNLEGVKMLVKHGAKVNDFANTSDSTQRASIHFAIDADQAAIALYLIHLGAENKQASCERLHALKFYRLPAETDCSWSCLSALHMAIIKNMPDVVNALCEKKNIDIRSKASGGNTVLHLALMHERVEIIDLFKKFNEFDSLLSLKNDHQQTPLSIAKEKNMLSLLDKS